jgi:hypothetical protein
MTVDVHLGRVQDLRRWTLMAGFVLAFSVRK